jgi:hypothetical protein
MASDASSPSRSPPRRELENFLVQYQPGNCWLADEPDLREESTQVWRSQVLVPSSTSLCAYLGPLEKDESEETKALFPHDITDLLLVFARNPNKPYNLHYLETRVFRSAPIIDKVEDYIAYLDRIKAHKGNIWKDLGIFYLIQLSRQGPRYQ